MIRPRQEMLAWSLCLYMKSTNASLDGGTMKGAMLWLIGTSTA